MKNRINFLTITLFLATLMLFSPDRTKAQDTGDKFAVIIPEQIDRDWYWVLYSDVKQHLVQAKVEKSLIRAGVDVIDISVAEVPEFNGNWPSIHSRSFAVKLGAALKVDYVVSGYATAVKASQSVSYGITTVRTQVDIIAKIIRVSDGQIMDVFDESQLAGGQSVQAAAQTGLREAGGVIGGKIGRWAKTNAAEKQVP